MKRLIIEIWNWKGGFCQYFKYSYRLTFWLYLNRIRKAKGFLKNHLSVFLRIGVILFAILTGFFVDIFGSTAFTADTLSGYLVAIGAMSGGAIAIVFTISIFLIQNSADLYSSQYFEVYIHDWKEKIIYFVVISITLIFFGGSLWVASIQGDSTQSISDQVSSLIVYSSLFLVGLVFALIDWQYKTVRQKINPIKAILFLEAQGIRFLRRLQYDAEKIAGVLIAAQSDLTKDEALAKTYTNFLQTHIDQLDRQLENLNEITLKLIDRQEVGTARRGLDAIRNVIVSFLEARKTSSVAMTSGISLFAVTSDSQSFLFDNFDRVNRIGDKMMKEGKEDNAVHILRLYQSFANKAKDITYVGRTGDNPILETIVGSFSTYIDLGIRHKNLEVVFQSISKLGDMGVVAVVAKQSSMLLGIQNKIMEIAKYGFSEKITVIVDQCTNNYLKIILSVFVHRTIVAKFQFDTALKNIKNIAFAVFVGRNTGQFPIDYTSGSSMTKAYNDLQVVVAQIINGYAKITDERDKDMYRSDICDFFEDLANTLRLLSEEIRSCDNLLVESVGRLLFYVNEIIIDLIPDPEFKKEERKLIQLVGANIHLPSFFSSHSIGFDVDTNNFRSLIESVAKTGLLAISKLDNKNLALDAIHSLSYMTNHALEKGTDGYGYGEPRMFEKICYIGILALKKGWYEIFVTVKMLLFEFQRKYESKYFKNMPSFAAGVIVLGPQKDQLRIELMKWRDDFDHERLNGMLRIRDDAEAMMYALITVADIDWFIFRIWNEWDTNSPVKADIEKEVEIMQKQQAIKKLNKILTLRAETL